jgi:hypothetical protein
MKHISLLGLCSILLLITACNRGGSCSSCCRTSTTTETTIAQESTPQDQDVATSVSLSDKEELEEAELVDVMTNK